MNRFACASGLVLFLVASAPGAATPPTQPAGGPNPAATNGLAIDVKPAKPAFAVGEPVAFTVTFRNASDKPFMLYDAGWTLGYRITLGPWQAFRVHTMMRLRPKPQDSKDLAPGESLTVDFKLAPPWRYRRADANGPATHDHLPPGKYDLVVTRDFKPNPADGPYPHPHWTGPATSAPTPIEIAAEPPGK